MLAKLFLAYADGKRLSFTSWFLNWLGQTFLGRPEDKGLDGIRPDLLGSYYYTRDERILPPKGERRQWREQAIKVELVRQFEHLRVALIAAGMGVVLTVALVVVGALLGQARATTQGVQATVSGWFSGEDAPAAEDGVDKSLCLAIKEKAMAGRNQFTEDERSVLNDPALLNQCAAILKPAQSAN